MGPRHKGWRRKLGACLLMVAAFFCFFLVSSPHRTRFAVFIHRLPEYSDFLMPSNTSMLLEFQPPLRPKPHVITNTFFDPKATPEGFLVHSPGCSIPDFDPYHHSIKSYISKPKEIKCGRPPSFTSSRGSTLYIHRDTLNKTLSVFAKIYENNKPKPKVATGKTIRRAPQPAASNSSGAPSTPSPPLQSTVKPGRIVDVKDISSDDVKCCYKGIYRVEQKRKKAGGGADGRWRYSKKCMEMNSTETKVEEEAVLVECRINKILVYTNIHYFFHRDKYQTPTFPTFPPSSRGVTASPGTPMNQRHTNTSSTQPEIKGVTEEIKRTIAAERLNVLIIGTDSASRLNMLRHLSKTYKYLTKELGAVDVKGYNKVGDNTFPNVAAILIGQTREEMDNHSCRTKSKHYDDCPIIWKDFKRNQYVTAYMEDAPWMGSFHYLRNGFISKPTDYYGRPFMLASEKEIGSPPGNRGHYCQGNTLSIKVVQDYALEFARAFIDVPFFGYLWSASLTHDIMNNLAIADDYYVSLLQEMYRIGVFNNTALFFISDHGMRWGDIRSTYIGMMEERLPYVLFHLPVWFRNKYHQAYSNLITNTNRLTSNFDLHETLLDLAYGRFANLSYVTSEPSRKHRGTSLFRRISWDRTCAEANVPNHFCVCQDTKEVSQDDPDLEPAANQLVETVNERLMPHQECELFTKIKVLSGRILVPNKKVTPKHSKSVVVTYLLQASLTPGNVVVEATVTHSNHDTSFKVTGDISRINKYGSTSACVKDDILRKYCYCKDQKEAARIFSKLAKEQGGKVVTLRK